MASILYECTVSVHWEVRDSAMEVVLEMAQLSAVSKFNFRLVNNVLLFLCSLNMHVINRVSAISAFADKFTFT